jgi:LysW-gamma-L-lysine carboxypeptidase
MTLSDSAAVDLLTKVLHTRSWTGEEEHVGELLRAVMERAGFAVERDEVGNVIGAFGPEAAARSLVILGHMDTVPGEIPVEQLDGNLYGRGAVDAKGPLTSALVAAVRAAAHTTLRVSVIGAVQEEGPSVGARHLRGRPAPDFLIIAEPSGWDAVVLGYKGSQRFTVEITQPAVHTAVPEPTAPERLVDFWVALKRWCAEQTGDRQGTGTFDRLTAALIDINSSHQDGLRDWARMQIGLRLPPGLPLDEVRQGVQSLLPEGRFTFSPGEEAVRGGKNNPLVAAFVRSIRAEGGTPRFKVKTGTSDMNVVGPVWGCPMLAYGPGDSRLDHTPHEHVAIEEYLRGIRVLTRVLEEL